MKPRLQRSRLGLGLLATGLTLTLWAEGNQPRLTEAPPTLQGSTDALPTLRGSTEAPRYRHATELEEHVCQENSMRGDGPANDDCKHVPTGPIYEDDPWGRWNCATMGNRICGPSAMLHATNGAILALTG